MLIFCVIFLALILASVIFAGRYDKANRSHHAEDAKAILTAILEHDAAADYHALARVYECVCLMEGS